MHLEYHSRSQRPRSFWPAPRIETSGRFQISSPRFADFRSFCAVSGFFQNDVPVNDLFHEALNFGLKILGLGNISLKEKQYEVLKLLVVEKKDVLAVLPTGYGKSLIYQFLPPVLNNESRRKIYIFR